MEYLYIYLLQLANVLECVGIFGIIFFAILAIITGISYFNDVSWNSEISTHTKSMFKVSIIIFIVTVLAGIFPTKQTMLLFGGVYLGKTASKSLVVSEKMAKVNKIIDLELDKRIIELTSEKK